MEARSLLLFFLTVFPLICTPGPDILFIASQGISKGQLASFRAVAGVILGYAAHAILSAFGIAALVSASPFLFYVLKWVGVIYLIFLAISMLYSAAQKKDGITIYESEYEKISLWRGFFTSFLNPKGLLMYLAILPQFISPDGNTAAQALVLSVLFILGCALVYSAVGILSSKVHGHQISDRSRRRYEALAGSLLIGAAVKLTLQVK